MTPHDVLHRAAHRGQPRDPAALYRSARHAATSPDVYDNVVAVRHPARRTARRAGIAITGAVAVAASVAVVAGTVDLTRDEPGQLVTHTEPPTSLAEPPVPPSTEPPAPTTTTVPFLCGATFPVDLNTVGFMGPFDGPAPESIIARRPGQLVQHWTLNDQVFELRWPRTTDYTEAEMRASTGRPRSGFGSGNGLAPFGYTGECANFAVQTFAGTADEAAALGSALITGFGTTVRDYARATNPFVRERRTVDAPPPVMACRVPAGTPARPTTTDTVTGSPTAATPDEALRGFLDTDPVARGFADVNYIDFALPDGSHRYGYAVDADENIPALVTVRSTENGWTVTSYTVSGC